MSQSKQIQTTDAGWKGICKIGGVAALAQLACLLGMFIIIPIFGGKPNTAEEYFTMLQDNRLVGLLRLDLLTVILLFFFAVMFFGIYAALRQKSGAYAAFATVLVFVGVTLCLATDSSFSMLHLSDQYAAATTDVQRSQLLAAGEAMIASEMWHSTAGYVAGILLQGTGVFISIIMLQSKMFSKGAVYAGILANGFDLIQHIIHPFAPSISATILMIAGPFYLIWYPLLGRDLFRLGKSVKQR
ncbi:MAG: hypothetical protein GY832_24640 [Chloroflexi bacterium]|nr:hypothetical protein [Chloroflexota bacterium]